MNTQVATVSDFDISDFMTDPVKEQEGVWHKLGKGREIKLARANNPDYKRLLRAKYKANRDILDQEDDAASELNDEIVNELISQTVIKGLRVNGQDIPYSPAIGLEMLKNQDFVKRIAALSNNMEAYRLKAEDEAVKS